MSLFLTLLLVSYPLVIHFSIHAGRADIAIYFIAAVLLLPLVFSLFRLRRPALWMVMMSALSVILTVLGYNYASSMIVIPPILIFSSLFLFFGYSLRAEGTPVITRFAELILSDVEPDVRAYTRKATMAWMVFFFEYVTDFYNPGMVGTPGGLVLVYQFPSLCPDRGNVHYRVCGASLLPAPSCGLQLSGIPEEFKTG